MGATIEAENAVQTGTVDNRLVHKILEDIKERLQERFHIPSATYRLQFNKFFTFEQAREQIEYFKRLGISDIYASPYFKAGAESLHGYDIANHNELNPSIGTEEDYNRMVDEIHRLGMYQVLDMVPNHMGIGEEENNWWADVLENGQASVYARYFDIDWDPLNPKLSSKVLLPVLGDQYGQVLENGELQVRFVPEEGRLYLAYYDNNFPLSPHTYEDILQLNRDELLQELGPESNAALEYQSILTAIGHLPAHFESDPNRVAERNREKEIIKRRIAALCASEPKVCESIERAVEQINGTKGEPRSFDALDALLEKQPYRLSFWRVATEEINYRRFFDVNNLAAIQIDQPEVFEAAHRMVMRLLGEGKLNGLRIDHVDGLRDPAGYFQALQRGYFLEMCRTRIDEMHGKIEDAEKAELERALLERFETERATGPQSILNRPLYVVVEKILARGEQMPADWEIYGTTGYEYTNDVNGIFVDTANARAFSEIYSAFTGFSIKFDDLVYESKKNIMQVSLSSEVNTLTNMLTDISQGDRHYRDFTINGIRAAIQEVIACFPVYRTYITPDMTKPDKRDQQIIKTAIARAKHRNPATDPSIFDFLGNILMLTGCEDCTEEQETLRYNFVMKFQQVTGPVTAKGLEDTAFYVYNRLISLNEVGGEPGYFGNTPANFHRQQAERQRNWPHSLLTTSTHDTKRSEDVRVRIDVLSEMPKEWRAAVRKWARFNSKLKKQVEGAAAPSRNEEYFIYQTLLGVWPYSDQIGDDEYNELVERLQNYMRKALNEAKVNTSWVNPNEEYQAAVTDFITAILKRKDDNRFLADFIPFQKRIAHYGAFNSLSQVLLKITSPGAPDIYQGNEIWDFSLVDPDNRRPVDYDLRRRLLDQVDGVKDAQGVAELVEARQDGRIKLFVTSRALRYRNENRDIFDSGAYTALEAQGKQKESILAYARSYEDKTVVTVAPCLMNRLGKSGEDTLPMGQVWAGTWLPIPGASAGASFRNVFTGVTIEAKKQNGAVGLLLEETLAVFPVALLEKQ